MSCCIVWNYLDVSHILHSGTTGHLVIKRKFGGLLFFHFNESVLVQSCGGFLRRSVIVCNFDKLGVSAFRFGSAANEALGAYQSIFAVFRGWLVLFRLTASSVLFSLYCNLRIPIMFLVASEGW